MRATPAERGPTPTEPLLKALREIVAMGEDKSQGLTAWHAGGMANRAREALAAYEGLAALRERASPDE